MGDMDIVNDASLGQLGYESAKASDSSGSETNSMDGSVSSLHQMDRRCSRSVSRGRWLARTQLSEGAGREHFAQLRAKIAKDFPDKRWNRFLDSVKSGKPTNFPLGSDEQKRQKYLVSYKTKHVNHRNGILV